MEKVEIGKLNRRITFVKNVDYKTPSGLTKKRYEDAFSVWAKIEPARGKLYHEQFKEKIKDSVRITIRYRKDIDEGMLVKYSSNGNTRIWKIDTIINPNEGNITLELMCSESIMGKRE